MTEITGSVLDVVDALTEERAKVARHEATIEAQDKDLQKLVTSAGEAAALKGKLAVAERNASERERLANQYAQERDHAQEGLVRAERAVAALIAQNEAKDAELAKLAELAENHVESIASLEGRVRELEAFEDIAGPVVDAVEALREAIEDIAVPENDA